MLLLSCQVFLNRPLLAADDGVPAWTNIDGQEYPKIDSQLRATFRVTAPEAQKVQLDLGRLYDMTKGDGGVWTVTTDPLVPGFHYYFLVIDGFRVSDPASESFYGCGKMSSGIEVPSKEEDFYQIKDVPRGQIRQQRYYSKITESWRRCFVYLPPNYDTSADTRYPVLYLQHGAGEDERGWMTQGCVDIILDNLIAQGKAVPMIIVMDKGYAKAPGEQQQRFNFDTFAKVMIDEIIPMVDKTFRTIADREHRAMAGLSMGGMQTCMITLNNLDKFAWIGGFSGSGAGPMGQSFDPKTAYNGALADPNEFNKKVHCSGWVLVPRKASVFITVSRITMTRCKRPALRPCFLNRPAPRMNGTPGGDVSMIFAASV